MKLPGIIQQELDAIAGRWRIECGAKHWHIVIDDSLVGILPKSGKAIEERSRSTLNIRAQIRRHVSKFQHAAGVRHRSGTAASTEVTSHT